MSNNPVLSRLGFARKAGRLSLGFSASKEAIALNKARLIIIANDISPKTEKEIIYFANGRCPVRKIDFDLETVSRSIGFRAGVIAVNDDGFATIILNNLP